MENQYQKWVNLSYLAGAILIGYLAFLGSMKLVSVYDIEAKVKNVELIIRLGSIGISALFFLILYRHPTVNQFMNEVVVELSRVTWPAAKETRSATVIVIVMVLVTGLVLGLMDYIWTALLKWVI
ncbi:preprotein translocase subunit SecE [bacterium]|nr:preprotein translocase subunit SecE [bacterium]